MHSNVGDAEPGGSGMIGTDEVALNHRASRGSAVFNAVAPYPNHIAGSRSRAANGVIRRLNADAKISLSET